ncbi:hypothetical protein HYH02_002296 [Chlamydomonas schloesseri]|uniref:Transmembrane protein 19 n=1 Tax=Chlamydomonas schloesseri TaxID=2026947 RepID=A0A835WT67_9CHLO|nr:hypothetical protein HYH02_002296 [Chlamydomonas schloesseri]|eukprot:KAG2452959.1 hypothetical protein HYH02_002296 [Chlamydomonas schloesseri]
MARRGLAKGSLSRSGALAAFTVGAVHMTAGIQFGATLILFYLSSSKLTRVGAKRKAEVEEEHKEGGRRNAVQVLANSLAACVFAELLYILAAPVPAPAPAGGAGAGAGVGGWWARVLLRSGVDVHLVRLLLAGAFLGHYACCCADTWASELGILSRSRPRLITTGRPVPPGTNGGVSALGLACSAAGGAFMGAAFGATGALGCALGAPLRGGSLCPTSQTGMGAGSWLTGPAGVATLTGVGLACGLFGSLLDSLLGATLQYTGWDPRAARVVGWRHRHGAGNAVTANGVCSQASGQEAVSCGGKAGMRSKDGEGEADTAPVVHISGVPVLSNDAVNFVAAAVTACVGAALLVRS